jgi:hypothetical protein
VFNQTIAYRDKKVVGVFVRFRCRLALQVVEMSGDRNDGIGNCVWPGRVFSRQSGVLHHGTDFFGT